MRIVVARTSLIFLDKVYPCEQGIKVYYCRRPNLYTDLVTKPVATADLEGGMGTIDFPEADIDILAVHVKQPKYKFFPWLFYQWKIAELL